MNQQPQRRGISDQIEKAHQWWRACVSLREAAEHQTRLRGEAHEIAGRRQALAAAQDKCHQAYRDWLGWKDFGRRQSRRYG
jgi:hypothetical protein